MNERSESGAFLTMLASAWPTILAGVVAGMIVLGVFALVTAPEFGYTATIRIRYVAPTGVTGAPTADTYVALALSNDAQESAATSVGTDPQKMSEQVQAAIDPRDRNMIVIRTSDPSEDVAVAKSLAVADAAKSKAMEPVQTYIDYWLEKIASRASQVELAQQRVDRIRLQLENPDLTLGERRALEELEFTNTLRRNDSQQDIDDTHFLLRRSQATLSQLEDPSVTKNSSAPYYLSNVLRGGLIGLFAGIVVAAIAARRKEER
jgi:hypothetical protein